MLYSKITHGWVSQTYDSETGDCVQQTFIPDEQEQPLREDESGQPIDDAQSVELAATEKECPFDMVQP